MTELVLLFSALEAHWVRHHPEMLKHLRPPLPRGDVERALVELGLQPSGEMVDWWGWHDGLIESPSQHMRITGSRLEFLPLSTAINVYEMQRQAGLEAWEDGEPGEFWPRSYFPWVVDGGGGSFALDLTDPARGNPVRRRYKDHWDNEHVEANSMAAVVAAWLEFFDAGAWGYDDRIGGIGVVDEGANRELQTRFPDMT